MSVIVSINLYQTQAERLGRLAHRLGKTPGEVSGLLIEETLREDEFALIEFRPSPVGRRICGNLPSRSGKCY